MAVTHVVSQCFKNAVSVSATLFRVMVPIIIVVKVLRELGWIAYLAVPLEPVMALVGLPASMGLVWATALLNTVYASMVVFVSLAPDAGLTVAQTTVLCTMLLIAHGLPVELKVAQQCGVSMLGQGLLRVGAALCCGLMLHGIFDGFGLLQQPGGVFWTPGAEPATLAAWALREVRTLAAIFCIIFALMLAMRLLEWLRVTDLLQFLLRPVLRRMGIGPQAATVTIVGLALGLSYGSGLIIHESRSGRIGPRDLFHSLTLMGLAHALVEDTMLALLLGANFNGVFWGRLLFSLLFMALLLRVTTAMPDATFARIFLRRGAAMAAAPTGAAQNAGAADDIS
jgi:hypothetical protein